MPNPLEYFINVKNQGAAAFASVQNDIKKTVAVSKDANKDILDAEKARADQSYTIGKAQLFAMQENERRKLQAVRDANKGIVTDTRLTAQLIEREFGVVMPRAINTFISRMPAVQEAIGKAFGPAVLGAGIGMFAVGLEKMLIKVEEFSTNLVWERSGTTAGESFWQAWTNAYIGVNAEAQEKAFKKSNELAGKLIDKRNEADSSFGTRIGPGTFLMSRGSAINTPFGTLNIADAAKLDIPHREEFNRDAFKLSREYGSATKSAEATEAFKLDLEDKASKILKDQTNELEKLNAERKKENEEIAKARTKLYEQRTNRMGAARGDNLVALREVLGSPFGQQIANRGITIDDFSPSKSLDTLLLQNKLMFATAGISPSDIGMPQRQEGTIGQGLTEKNAQAIQALKDMVDQGKEAGRLIQQGADSFAREARQMGGKIFDALWQGHTGLVDLLKASVKAPAKTIFENVFGIAVGGLAGKAGTLIGGQVQKDSNGNTVYDDNRRPKLTKLGEILKGTPLGADTAKLQGELIIKNAADRHAQHEKTNELLGKMVNDMERTSEAVSANTPLGSTRGAIAAAVLAAVLSPSSGGGSNGGYGALINQGFGGGRFGIGGGGGLGGPFTPDSGWGGFSAGLGSPSSVWEGIGLNNTGTSSPNGLSSAQIAGSAVAAAGVLAAGVYGVKTGIQQGGVGGYAKSIGSAAGTAAALDPEPISKAVLGGIALAGGIVSAIFGSNGANRQKEIATAIGNERYYANQPLFAGREFALGGFEESNMHAGPYGVVAPYSSQAGFSPTTGASHTINLTINALDTQNIMDRAGDISAAVSHGITSGQAPQLVQTMREAN